MRAVSVSLLLACVQATAAAQAQGSYPPVRYVFQVKGNLQAMKPWIEYMHDTCKTVLEAQGKPVQPLKMPSAAEVAALVVIEKERLFSEGLEAEFERTSQLMPDARQGCRLRVAREYKASVGHVCGKGWAATASAGSGRDDDPDRDPKLRALDDIAESEKAIHRSCGLSEPKPKRAKAAIDFSRLPTTPTTVGVGCVWLDQAMQGETFEPLARLTGHRFCVHPGNPLQDRRTRFFREQHFTLKSDHAGPPASDFVAMTEGALNFQRGEAVAFQVGSPIPANRFTQQAVQAFVQQPLWVDLGGR
jgi:hypothetical protein